MIEWNEDFDSAPVDGARVLVDDGYSVYVAFWADIYGCKPHNVIEGQWCIEGAYSYDGLYRAVMFPKFWAPINRRKYSFK